MKNLRLPGRLFAYGAILTIVVTMGGCASPADAPQNDADDMPSFAGIYGVGSADGTMGTIEFVGDRYVSHGPDGFTGTGSFVLDRTANVVHLNDDRTKRSATWSVQSMLRAKEASATTVRSSTRPGLFKALAPASVRPADDVPGALLSGDPQQLLGMILSAALTCSGAPTGTGVRAASLQPSDESNAGSDPSDQAAGSNTGSGQSTEEGLSCLLSTLGFVPLTSSSSPTSSVPSSNPAFTLARASGDRICGPYQVLAQDSRGWICVDTGTAQEDPVGNFLIETVGTAGLNLGGAVLRRAVVSIAGRAGSQVTTTLGQAILGASTSENDCVFQVLSRLTGHSIEEISRITDTVIGRASVVAVRDMLDDLGVRVERQVFSSWDDVFANLEPNGTYMVAMKFPRAFIPEGGVAGHMVMIERGVPIDPSRGLRGPEVFSALINGEHVLFPVENVIVWRVLP